MISDEVLMLAFQRGSREAFDELYVRYRNPLYGFFQRRLNGEGRAEDLAQETFLVVIRGADRYEPRAWVRSYLYAIALKLLMSERRKRAHDGPDIDSVTEPAAHGSAERDLWVREGLRKLDDTAREILMLREYEQLSYSEIAEVLQMPLNTVRSRLFRARMALKERLAPDVKAPSHTSPDEFANPKWPIQLKGRPEMRENTHPLDQEEVMAYLDGELPGEDAARAAEHLRECCECQELGAGLHGVSRHMAAWQIDAADTGMTPTLISALQQHEAASARNFKPRASRWEVWLGGFRIPRPALVVSGAVLALLVVAEFMTTQHNLALRRQSTTMAESQVSEASPVPTESSSQASHRIEGADRDRLSAMRAQIASNMEYADRPAAPSTAAAPAADNNAGTAFYATSSRAMIARTAQLTIVVKDFDTSQRKVEEILKRHGGYVGEMTTSAPEGADRKLSATLRVPSSQLDSAIAEVKEIGRVESESQSGEEVTSQFVDLQARLTNARNTEQRLTELLRRQTGKLDEVVTVEEKISEVREQIERMEAERKSLGERVDFGTLSVSLSEQRKTQLQVMPPTVGTQFRNAAVEGYRGVVDSIVSFLVFLMSCGPSLLLWAAILFFPVRFAWRKLRRKMV